MSSVRIVEVSPRDGLQNESFFVPTHQKTQLIHRLTQTGLRNIEATSFVSPKWVPQLSDGAQVMQFLSSHPAKENVVFPVLVPNLRGLQEALKWGASEVAIFGSASEGFSKANINCSIEESLTRFREVCQVALEKGIRVRGYISCVIACPYDGPTPPENVLRVAQAMLQMGCYEISLGDTLGIGTPTHISRLLTLLLQHIPSNKLAGHFHDTYGQAVANVAKAYEMGIRVFDSSVAGLGGCPYAKGAKGNVATEDVVYLFEGMGVRTGVDLDQIVEVGEWISKELGRRNESRAGAALAAKKAKPTSIEENTATDQAVSTHTTSKELASTSDVLVSRNTSTATITLNNPKKGNILSSQMITHLTHTLSTLSSDPTIQTIILTNTGKYFCTGMDLSSSGPSTSGTSLQQLKTLLSAFEAVNTCPKTTIALIKGSCYGGGVGLAFCCDLRIALQSVKFVLSEVKRGLVPATISKYVVREWGPALAREAMITGRTVTAPELHQLGIIQELCEGEEDAERKAGEYVKRVETSAPGAVKEVKKLVNAVSERKGEEKEIERVFEEMMRPSDEAKHGIEEFRKGNREVDWMKLSREKMGPGKPRL